MHSFDGFRVTFLTNKRHLLLRYSKTAVTRNTYLQVTIKCSGLKKKTLYFLIHFAQQKRWQIKFKRLTDVDTDCFISFKNSERFNSRFSSERLHFCHLS